MNLNLIKIILITSILNVSGLNELDLKTSLAACQSCASILNECLTCFRSTCYEW